MMIFKGPIPYGLSAFSEASPFKVEGPRNKNNSGARRAAFIVFFSDNMVNLVIVPSCNRRVGHLGVKRTYPSQR